ncbi:MAG TPA: pantetheine-phosphate adenylyltransferase [Bdellovibrionota bacterium]|jgi:pantetheine-phosphate adenylyltransferase|nr:pantetheine-phosphate adenylyltransferase [Bdellovibrionota bacterium]
MKRVAVYAGSFDPPTLGHMDIVRRAAPLFDELYVLVAYNTAKHQLFSVEERVQLLKDSCRELKLKVKVESHQGLVVDFCKKVDAKILIRGIRAVSDFEKEFQIATMNRHLDANIESLHIMTDEKYFYLSSSLVKEVASMGTDMSKLVPKSVIKALASRLLPRTTPQSQKRKTTK